THSLREQIYRMVFPCADWMCGFRRERLPLPSYDLWEERFGVHLHTVASVHGAIRAARDFAMVLGEKERLRRYTDVVDELRAALVERFWDEERGHFLRMLTCDEEGRLSNQHPDCKKLDSAAASLVHFGVLPPEDPKLVSTM